MNEQDVNQNSTDTHIELLWTHIFPPSPCYFSFLNKNCVVSSIFNNYIRINLLHGISYNKLDKYEFFLSFRIADFLLHYLHEKHLSQTSVISSNKVYKYICFFF